MRQSGQQTTGGSAALHGGYSSKSGYDAAMRQVKSRLQRCKKYRANFARGQTRPILRRPW